MFDLSTISASESLAAMPSTGQLAVTRYLAPISIGTSHTWLSFAITTMSPRLLGPSHAIVTLVPSRVGVNVSQK